MQLTFWDTAGQEKTQSITKNFYIETKGCILVFDLTDRSSFDNVEFWRKDFFDKFQPLEGEKYPFILIGNKNDREDFSFVKEEDIKDYCSSHNNMPYFSCSAKTGDNVKEAFTKIAELALNKENEKNIGISEEKKYIKIDTKKEKIKKLKESQEKNQEENQGPNKNNNNFCCL